MQYELAKAIMPFFLWWGGYESTEDTVRQCRDTIDVQEQANEESRINWMASFMDDNSAGSNSVADSGTP